ncbi:MAG: hypothetical protein IRZ00_15545 [Gemmatimonadetes bacterium]|nr:hypothetical protein [Gemmatimonadota bacterium]
MAPLAALALGTGVLLGSLTRWGLLRHGWVTTKLAITTVLAGVLLFVLVPRLGDAAAAALTPAGVPAAARLRFAVGPAVSSVLLLVNVALGVYKPRRRARRGSAA